MTSATSSTQPCTSGRGPAIAATLLVARHLTTIMRINLHQSAIPHQTENPGSKPILGGIVTIWWYHLESHNLVVWRTFNLLIPYESQQHLWTKATSHNTARVLPSFSMRIVGHVFEECSQQLQRLQVYVPFWKTDSTSIKTRVETSPTPGRILHKWVCLANAKMVQKFQKKLDTFGGRNTAPVDSVNIPLFTGFHASRVHDFFHQR